jgi:hypothetical protein
MALSPTGVPPEMINKALEVTRETLGLLENRLPAAEADGDSAYVQEGMKKIGDLIGGQPAPHKRIFVKQGRNIFRRADVSGWDDDFQSDDDALRGIKECLLVFDTSFDEKQCSEMENALQSGTAHIVKRDLVDTFGYNALVRSNKGGYSLITLVEA